MNFPKYAPLLALIISLTACGHGFEGEYESKSASSIAFMNTFAGSIGSQKIVIGSDYIESEGQRQEFDDIFVRESGNQKYLVFKTSSSETAWKIIDNDNLIQGNEIMHIKLVKVK